MNGKIISYTAFAFIAGVLVASLMFLHYEAKTSDFPLTCPEGSVCYRTIDHTIWEFSECVLDFNNNLIICSLIEGKVKNRPTPS